jgi:hypothetical protein
MPIPVPPHETPCKCSPLRTPLPSPHIIPFDLSTKIAATIPPTSTKKPIQKHQHIHVRCRRFRRWPSSHESLLEGSAVMFVQNLKRDGGRPERPMVRFDALPWRVKGAWICASDGLRGDLGDFALIFVLCCEGDFLRRRPDGVRGIELEGDVGGESGASGERGNASWDIGERGGGCDSRVKGRCEDGVVGDANVEGISRDITYECLRSCFSASSLWTATLKRCQKLGSWIAAMDGAV